MKRLLLSLITLCATVVIKAQTEITFDFDKDATALFGIEGRSSNDSHDGDILEAATATIDGVSVTVSPKASGSNENRLWTTSPTLRIYSGTMTVSAPDKKILSISYNSSKFDASNTFDSGTYASNTWTATSDVETVVLTVNKNTQLKGMTVTVASSEAVIVAKPTVSVAGGTYYEPQSVELAAEEGAVIKYTLNGGEEQTYTGAITISEATTLVAWAEKDGAKSGELTVEYAFATTSTGTLASAIASADNDVITIGEAMTVVYQYGAYLYVKAGETYALIYKQGGVGISYNAGDVIAAGVTVKKTTYSGLVELIEPDGLTEGVAGTPVEPITTDALTCASAEWVNKYVKISGASYHAATKMLEDAEGEIAMYKRFDTALPIEDMTDVTVVGIIGVYNDTYQLQPITINGDEVQKPVDPNANSKDNPYTVSEALAIINTEGFTGTVAYVKGIISKISDADITKYGNATYFIVDPETTEPELEVYRGTGLNGAKFIAADDILVGDTVVVYGNLTLYNTTPEFEAGSQILSLGRPATTTPDDPSTPDDPVTPDDPTEPKEVLVVEGNLLQNGSFEEWAGNAPEHWNGVAGNATISAVTTKDAHTGKAAVQIAKTSSNKRIAYKEMTLEAGVYEFSFYVRAVEAENDTTSVIPGYVPIDEEGKAISTKYTYNYSAEAHALTNEYQKVVSLFELAETTKINLVIMQRKNTASTIIDDVALVRTEIPVRVSSAKADKKQQKAIYTIGGIRTMKAMRGIHIIDGKKVVVK